MPFLKVLEVTAPWTAQKRLYLSSTIENDLDPSSLRLYRRSVHEEHELSIRLAGSNVDPTWLARLRVELTPRAGNLHKTPTSLLLVREISWKRAFGLLFDLLIVALSLAVVFVNLAVAVRLYEAAAAEESDIGARTSLLTYAYLMVFVGTGAGVLISALFAGMLKTNLLPHYQSMLLFVACAPFSSVLPAVSYFLRFDEKVTRRFFVLPSGSKLANWFSRHALVILLNLLSSLPQTLFLVAYLTNKQQLPNRIQTVAIALSLLTLLLRFVPPLLQRFGNRAGFLFIVFIAVAVLFDLATVVYSTATLLGPTLGDSYWFSWLGLPLSFFGVSCLVAGFSIAACVLVLTYISLTLRPIRDLLDYWAVVIGIIGAPFVVAALALPLLFTLKLTPIACYVAWKYTEPAPPISGSSAAFSSGAGRSADGAPSTLALPMAPAAPMSPPEARPPSNSLDNFSSFSPSATAAAAAAAAEESPSYTVSLDPNLILPPAAPDLTPEVVLELERRDRNELRRSRADPNSSPASSFVAGEAARNAARGRRRGSDEHNNSSSSGSKRASNERPQRPPLAPHSTAAAPVARTASPFPTTGTAGAGSRGVSPYRSTTTTTTAAAAAAAADDGRRGTMSKQISTTTATSASSSPFGATASSSVAPRHGADKGAPTNHSPELDEGKEEEGDEDEEENGSGADEMMSSIGFNRDALRLLQLGSKDGSATAKRREQKVLDDIVAKRATAAAQAKGNNQKKTKSGTKPTGRLTREKSDGFSDADGYHAPLLTSGPANRNSTRQSGASRGHEDSDIEFNKNSSDTLATRASRAESHLAETGADAEGTRVITAATASSDEKNTIITTTDDDVYADGEVSTEADDIIFDNKAKAAFIMSLKICAIVFYMVHFGNVICLDIHFFMFAMDDARGTVQRAAFWSAAIGFGSWIITGGVIALQRQLCEEQEKNFADQHSYQKQKRRIAVDLAVSSLEINSDVHFDPVTATTSKTIARDIAAVSQQPPAASSRPRIMADLSAPILSSDEEQQEQQQQEQQQQEQTEAGRHRASSAGFVDIAGGAALNDDDVAVLNEIIPVDSPARLRPMQLVTMQKRRLEFTQTFTGMNITNGRRYCRLQSLITAPCTEVSVAMLDVNQRSFRVDFFVENFSADDMAVGLIVPSATAEDRVEPVWRIPMAVSLVFRQRSALPAVFVKGSPVSVRPLLFGNSSVPMMMMMAAADDDEKDRHEQQQQQQPVEADKLLPPQSYSLEDQQQKQQQQQQRTGRISASGKKIMRQDDDAERDASSDITHVAIVVVNGMLHFELGNIFSGLHKLECPALTDHLLTGLWRVGVTLPKARQSIICIKVETVTGDGSIHNRSGGSSGSGIASKLSQNRQNNNSVYLSSSSSSAAVHDGSADRGLGVTASALQPLSGGGNGSSAAAGTLHNNNNKKYVDDDDDDDHDRDSDQAESDGEHNNDNNNNNNNNESRSNPDHHNSDEDTTMKSPSETYEAYVPDALPSELMNEQYPRQSAALREASERKKQLLMEQEELLARKREQQRTEQRGGALYRPNKPTASPGDRQQQQQQQRDGGVSSELQQGSLSTASWADCEFTASSQDEAQLAALQMHDAHLIRSASGDNEATTFTGTTSQRQQQRTAGNTTTKQQQQQRDRKNVFEMRLRALTSLMKRGEDVHGGEQVKSYALDSLGSVGLAMYTMGMIGLVVGLLLVIMYQSHANPVTIVFSLNGAAQGPGSTPQPILVGESVSFSRLVSTTWEPCPASSTSENLIQIINETYINLTQEAARNNGTVWRMGLDYGRAETDAQEKRRVAGCLSPLVEMLADNQSFVICSSVVQQAWQASICLAAHGIAPCLVTDIIEYFCLYEHLPQSYSSTAAAAPPPNPGRSRLRNCPADATATDQSPLLCSNASSSGFRTMTDPNRRFYASFQATRPQLTPSSASQLVVINDNNSWINLASSVCIINLEPALRFMPYTLLIVSPLLEVAFLTVTQLGLVRVVYILGHRLFTLVRNVRRALTSCACCAVGATRSVVAAAIGSDATSTCSSSGREGRASGSSSASASASGGGTTREGCCCCVLCNNWNVGDNQSAFVYERLYGEKLFEQIVQLGPRAIGCEFYHSTTLKAPSFLGGLTLRAPSRAHRFRVVGINRVAVPTRDGGVEYKTADFVLKKFVNPMNPYVFETCKLVNPSIIVQLMSVPIVLAYLRAAWVVVNLCLLIVHTVDVYKSRANINDPLPVLHTVNYLAAAMANSTVFTSLLFSMLPLGCDTGYSIFFLVQLTGSISECESSCLVCAVKKERAVLEARIVNRDEFYSLADRAHHFELTTAQKVPLYTARVVFGGVLAVIAVHVIAGSFLYPLSVMAVALCALITRSMFASAQVRSQMSVLVLLFLFRVAVTLVLTVSLGSSTNYFALVVNGFEQQRVGSHVSTYISVDNGYFSVMTREYNSRSLACYIHSLRIQFESIATTLGVTNLYSFVFS